MNTTEIILDEQHHNQQVEVAYKDTLLVELSHQPGIGYYWVWQQADSIPNKLKLIGEEVLSEQSRPGGEALQQFCFSAIEKGEYKLNLDLKRHWENSVLRQYSVSLQIK
ncbi:protease inhibitor I42 family protein [Tunicatimonas pelagia]|uniref:protease inhibitor I42 family protein n=1 Tax=Tunicatimonas pelagia TaxID=931531 RepID=UPI002666490D|nr:protease inhibitor I42 family protein [Tunicatimonas pelagia]WKN41074.1 protease inhibitor I42 family protein [Tunicatimonas pelagia]